MKRKDVTQYRKTLTWLGFKKKGRQNIFGIAFGLVNTVLTVNSVFLIINKWDDVPKRIEGLKALTSLLIGFIYLTAMLNWDNSMLLVKTIEEGIYKSTYQRSLEQATLEETINENIISLNTIWFHGLNIFISVEVAAPVIVFFFRVIQQNTIYLPEKMLHTSYPSYIPKGYPVLPVYFVFVLFQSYYFVFAIKSSYVVVISAFPLMQVIEGDLKLLTLEVNKMDNSIENYIRRFNENGARLEKSEKYVVSLEDIATKMFFKHFLKQHIDIYRKLEDVKKVIRLLAWTVNTSLSALLCMTIYSFVKREDILGKVQEIVFGNTILVCLYCYGLMGERIMTQDANLRLALYESSWVEKPQWFKKSIQMILTRTNKPIELKSAGMFELNLRNFLTLVRAAYSYYNILNTF